MNMKFRPRKYSHDFDRVGTGYIELTDVILVNKNYSFVMMLY
jgi:hypothetical protein